MSSHLRSGQQLCFLLTLSTLLGGHAYHIHGTGADVRSQDNLFGFVPYPNEEEAHQTQSKIPQEVKIGIVRSAGAPPDELSSVLALSKLLSGEDSESFSNRLDYLESSNKRKNSLLNGNYLLGYRPLKQGVEVVEPGLEDNVDPSSFGFYDALGSSKRSTRGGGESYKRQGLGAKLNLGIRLMCQLDSRNCPK